MVYPVHIRPDDIFCLFCRLKNLINVSNTVIWLKEFWLFFILFLWCKIVDFLSGFWCVRVSGLQRSVSWERRLSNSSSSSSRGLKLHLFISLSLSLDPLCSSSSSLSPVCSSLSPSLHSPTSVTSPVGTLDPSEGMKRHHGFHGVVPRDWPSHSESHHPGGQLRHPPAGLPHLLHPLRLPRQRPHQGVCSRRSPLSSATTWTVTHTPGGHAELTRFIPHGVWQHGGPWRAAHTRTGPGEGEEEHSGVKRRRKRRRTKRRRNQGLRSAVGLLCFYFEPL